MSESNAEWGLLAEHDDEAAELWDSYSRLPEAGVDPILDAFCERKRIGVDGLVRLGARLAGDGVLAFAYPGGLKYRNLISGDKWSRADSTWKQLKVVRAGTEPTREVIVVEGETDAARLTMAYGVDIAVLPAGARTVKPAYLEQLREYELVLVGTDADQAGEDGATKILDAIPQAVRFTPPRNDWCETQDDELPELPVVPPPRDDIRVLVRTDELLALPEPEVFSWFEKGVLPVGGFMIVHGWAKSFKSFLTFDLMAQLAQGQDWLCFEPAEEAAKVAIIQFEVPFGFYQRDRIAPLQRAARAPELLAENLLHYSPMSRPQLTAGNRKQEDKILGDLVEGGVQVVLIDPIRRATGSIDMNAEQDVRKMLAFIERLNDEGITVVATHHDSKDGARHRGGESLDMTGSGAFAGDPDSIISIQLPKGEKYGVSLKRNVHFSLRNAPPLAPRGFEMQDNSTLLYHTTSFDNDDEEYEDENAPSI